MSGFAEQGEDGTKKTPDPTASQTQGQPKPNNEPKTLDGGIGSTPRPNRPGGGGWN